MRLHHVSIPVPPGELETGKRFYTEVFGLQPIPTPEALGDRVAWFGLDGRELHLFIEPEANATPSGRHFCFEVDDIQAVRERLEASNVEIEETTPIPNRPRFFCADPLGNRIEVTQILGKYGHD